PAGRRPAASPRRRQARPALAAARPGRARARPAAAARSRPPTGGPRSGRLRSARRAPSAGPAGRALAVDPEPAEAVALEQDRLGGVVDRDVAAPVREHLDQPGRLDLVGQPRLTGALAE